MISDQLSSEELLSFLIAIFSPDRSPIITTWLIHNYGLYMALIEGVSRHPNLMVCSVAKNLLDLGSALPRYIMRDIQRQSALRPSVVLLFLQWFPKYEVIPDDRALIDAAFNNRDFEQVKSLVNEHQFIPVHGYIPRQNWVKIWIILMKTYPEYLIYLKTKGYTLQICEEFRVFSILKHGKSDRIRTLQALIDTGIIPTDTSSMYKLLELNGVTVLREMKFPMAALANVIEDSLLKNSLACNIIYSYWPDDVTNTARILFKLADGDWEHYTNGTLRYTPIPHQLALWIVNHAKLPEDETLMQIICENLIMTLYIYGNNADQAIKLAHVISIYMRKGYYIQELVSKMPMSLLSFYTTQYLKLQPEKFVTHLIGSKRMDYIRR